MSIEVPDVALKHGFVNRPAGVHTSKTIMLKELSLLLAASGSSASYEDYRGAALHDNVLLKATSANRSETFGRLAQEYGLRPEVTVFRALRNLWPFNSDEHPMLAMLCALARDPLLRATAPVVLSLEAGASVAPKVLEDAVTAQFPDRYNPLVRQRLGENTISSWVKSGHLTGKLRKERARATAGPVSAAYALFLGHLCGVEGTALFETFWARATDMTAVQLDALAFAASQRGWIDYRRIGNVAEIGFTFLLAH